MPAPRGTPGVSSSPRAPRFLSAAVEGGAAFAGMVLCPRRLVAGPGRDLVTRLERAGVPRLRASPEAYRALSPGSSEAGENAAAGQGVLLVLRQGWESLPERPGDPRPLDRG